VQFGASGGVVRPTICADFQVFAPVRVAVETPACRQAAASLAEMRGRHSICELPKKRVASISKILN